MRQAEQLGLGDMLCFVPSVLWVRPLFAVLLADDFLTDSKLWVTMELTRAFNKGGIAIRNGSDWP